MQRDIVLKVSGEDLSDKEAVGEVSAKHAISTDAHYGEQQSGYLFGFLTEYERSRLCSHLRISLGRPADIAADCF